MSATVKVLFDSVSILVSKSLLLLLLRGTFRILLFVAEARCTVVISSKFGWKLEILDGFDLQPQSNEYDVGEIHDDLAFVLSLSLLSKSHLSTGIVLGDIQILSYSERAGREFFTDLFRIQLWKMILFSKPIIEFSIESKSFSYTIIGSF